MHWGLELWLMWGPVFATALTLQIGFSATCSSGPFSDCYCPTSLVGPGHGEDYFGTLVSPPITDTHKCLCISRIETIKSKITTTKNHPDRLVNRLQKEKKILILTWVFIVCWALQILLLALHLGWGWGISVGVIQHLIARLKSNQVTTDISPFFPSFNSRLKRPDRNPEAEAEKGSENLPMCLWMSYEHALSLAIGSIWHYLKYLFGMKNTVFMPLLFSVSLKLR